MPAGVTLALATFCNLASPVVTGMLFEILTGGQPFSQYPKYLAVLGTLYIVEPLVTRVYINNACAAGEKASLAAQHLLQQRALLLSLPESQMLCSFSYHNTLTTLVFASAACGFIP